MERSCVCREFTVKVDHIQTLCSVKKKLCQFKPLWNIGGLWLVKCCEQCASCLKVAGWFYIHCNVLGISKTAMKWSRRECSPGGSDFVLSKKRWSAMLWMTPIEKLSNNVCICEVYEAKDDRGTSNGSLSSDRNHSPCSSNKEAQNYFPFEKAVHSSFWLL